MNIGLFFGSFNPIHVGHLIIAESALNHTNLDRVWIVVSPQNPFKDKKNLGHEFDRLKMVDLALTGNPRIQSSNVEFNLPKPSYTVDTLLHLRERFPSYTFSIIMGEDNLEHLHKWKNHEAILNHYTVYVYPRPGAANTNFAGHPSVHRLEFPLLDISATQVRALIAQKKSVRYLIPDSVIAYIEKHGLYGA